jgi:RNA polymerase sigma factor (sigma-70 family)
MPTAPTATRARVSLTPLASLEDADLVRRARDGDDCAFEEIVRRYRVPLIRYSTRHVGRDHAEDVTQHALARAAMHLRDDPRPIHLRAWLYRVAHNAAINMRQRKDFGHEELSPDIDGVPQPPELAAQRAEVREVVSEMDRLPDRQRTALLLSVFEGLGYDEIATRLETSPNSVRALLSRARVHLRKAAAALAPVPLLQWLMRKASGVASATGGQGGVAAGGGVLQAKLVAVVATTAVAGAATAERATSQDPQSAGAGQHAALIAGPPAPSHHAAPLSIATFLPGAKEHDTAVRDRSAPAEQPIPAADPVPEPVAEEPAPPPVDPIPEAPPAEPEPVIDEPPAEPPVEEPPADETSKDDFEGTDPATDGEPTPPPDGYTPTTDAYTPLR